MKKTPAQEAGFVIGKQYRTVKGEGEWLPAGSVLTFLEDDGSECPQFSCDERVFRGGKVFYELSLLEAAGDDTDYSVSINPNSTTIVIQKRLTLDEVAAVLKAAGV